MQMVQVKEDTMNIDSTRRAIRLAALILSLTWIPSLVEGQTAKAESFGIAVSTATINQQSASAVAPAEGGMSQAEAAEVTVASLVTAQDAKAIAGGSSDGAHSDAVSSASLGRLSILGGVITADGVVAMATSTPGQSDAAGSGFANLVVNGVGMSAPAPNTRVELPGAGYAVLNEQIATAGGLQVNMIHVVLQQPTLLGGYQTVGSIIVGSASSNVN
jgi:hypothetical protein